MASFSFPFPSSQLVTGPAYQVDKWLLSPGGPVAARSRCATGLGPPGPALLFVFWGVQGARGEAYPRPLFGSYCLPTRIWPGDQTSPPATTQQ